MRIFRRLVCYACVIAALLSLFTPPVSASYEGLPSAWYGDEPETVSNCDILYEVHSGQILFEKNAYEAAYPASTTKIMTALLALENCEMDETVTVTPEAWKGINRSSSIAGLSTGECLPMYDALICLLVASGNEAANAIAIHIAGSIGAFVDMMNQRAQELGCQNTHFENPNGLHDENHYTCAYDLLLITLEARKYQTFRDIVGMSRAVIAPTNKCETERKFNSTNLLLSNTSTSEYLYSKATGVKTGYTTPAGYCLVSSAQNEELEFVSVVLGGAYVKRDNGTTVNGCYRDALRLYRWAFENFKVKKIVTDGEIITETFVDQAKDIDHVLLEATADISYVMHKKQNIDERFTTVSNIRENIVAPLEKDEILGTLMVYLDGKFYTSCDLVSASVVERSPVLSGYAKFKESLKSSNARFALTGIVIIAAGYIAFVIAYNAWRKKHPKRRRRR